MRNVLTNWAGHGLNVVVLFFLTPLIIDTLGKTQYGVWSTVIMLTGYLGVLDIGIRGSTGRYIIYHIGRGDADGVNSVVRTSLGFFSVTGVVMMLAAALLGIVAPGWFKGLPADLAGLFPLLVPLLALNTWMAAVSVIYSNVLAGHDRFDLTQGVNVAVLLARSLGTVLVLIYGGGLIMLALVTVMANVLGLVGNYLLAHRIYRPLHDWPPMIDRARLKQLFGFGIPTFVSTVALRIINQTDLLLIGLLLGVSLVTLYSVSAMLILYSWAFLELIVGTMFPPIQRAAARGEMGQVRWLVLRMARLTAFCGIPVYIGFIIFGHEFIGLWVPTLGSQAADAATVLSVLAAARLVALFSEGHGHALQSVGIVRTPAALSVAEALLNLTISLVLVMVFGWGLVGIATGTLGAIVVMRGLVMPLYTFGKLEIMPLQYIRQIFVPAVLTATSFAAASWAILMLLPQGTWSVFFLKVLLALAAYGLISLLLLVSGSERRQVASSFGRLLGRRRVAKQEDAVDMVEQCN